MLQPAPGRLTRLYAAMTALAREALYEAELFPLIVRQVAELLEARYAALGLLAPDGERLSHLVTTGLTDEEYAALKHEPPHGRGILGAPLVCVVSGSGLAEMERMAPGGDLYVEKVRVPEELDRIVAAARGRG